MCEVVWLSSKAGKATLQSVQHRSEKVDLPRRRRVFRVSLIMKLSLHEHKYLSCYINIKANAQKYMAYLLESAIEFAAQG